MKLINIYLRQSYKIFSCRQFLIRPFDNYSKTQPGKHSMWESRKVSISPVASPYPRSRARIKPSRFGVLTTRTFPFPFSAKYSSSSVFKNSGKNYTSVKINSRVYADY